MSAKKPIILDAYEQLFEFVPKRDLFGFGLKNLVLSPLDAADAEWRLLKERIGRQDRNLAVRNFGQKGRQNTVLSKLYREIMGIVIKYDPTNNSAPTRQIQRLTGYRKNKSIVNYQVSHVFGKTKNVYCFTAPWNIVFIPKILDPFTGHEAKGHFVQEFQKLFRQKVYKTYADQITDYNRLIKPLRKEVNQWLNRERALDEQSKASLKEEFNEIHP